MTDQPRHFLDIDQLETASLRHILDRAAALKADPAAYSQSLSGRTLVMIFEKPSTRTRVSFEVGMSQLGGRVVVLGENDSQLGRGESIADTARVLSRYADAIMIRTNASQKLTTMAEYSSISVINGLTDESHPCQIMADILTFEEHLGPIKGRTVAWVGDGNNVAASWLQAGVRLGFKFHVATPEEHRLPRSLIEWAASESGEVAEFDAAVQAVKGADCVVTDTWVSMGDDWEREKRINRLKPFQVDERLMSDAADNAIFMHCLPAHRGEEVVEEVIDGPQSVVWDEAENRLHAQKAVLLWCLNAG